ncbi:MAG: HWE histidine kinase domain-containing protein [Sphingomicrobium sp.]
MEGFAGTSSGTAQIVALSDDRVSVTRDLPRRSRTAVPADCCSYLHSLLEASADSVAAIEADGTIGFITPRLLWLFHESDPARLIGRPWLSIWPGDCPDKLRATLDRALSGSAARCEIDCVDHEMRRTWWEISLTPVKLRGPAVAGNPSATTVVAVARDVTDYHEALREAEVLGRELHHRVRNMMSMLQAIVRIAATTSTDSAAFIDSIEDRVHAMARTHELLCEGTDGEVDVGDLLRGELLPFKRDHAIVIKGPPVNVREPRAAALGLALHELTINAVKYGGLSTAAGRISVTWEVRESGEQLHLSWHEEGGPAVVTSGRPGFGSMLLDHLLADQLTVTREWRATGLHATITIDLRLPPPAPRLE